jgi:hypothetical protein
MRRSGRPEETRSPLTLSHMWNLSTFSLVLTGAYVLSFIDFLGRPRWAASPPVRLMESVAGQDGPTLATSKGAPLGKKSASHLAGLLDLDVARICPTDDFLEGFDHYLRIAVTGLDNEGIVYR